MDSIASSGMLFTRAYCADPLCAPSRTSMFSGRYPHETGVLSNYDLSRQTGPGLSSTYKAGALSNYDFSMDMPTYPRLGRIFMDAGYDTGYVGKWHMPYPTEDPATHGFRFRANDRFDGADLHNSNEAIQFLQAQRTAPFFLVASYNNPHNICGWARGARGSLPDGAIADPPSLAKCPPLRPNHRPPSDETEAMSLLRRSYHASPTFPVGQFGEKQWREYLWAYYRMIETVDARIAEVLEALESTGQRENTVVVFLSDHGDSQGAHLWNQKTVLYDESSRVPFIISYPQRIKPGVSDALLQTGIDLMPTLCDVAGLAIPQNIPGRSMLDAAMGMTGENKRPYVVAQTRFGQGAQIDGATPQVDGRMLCSQRFKYCVYDMGQRRESLVDMEMDPGETVNLAVQSEYQHILEDHRRDLKEFCSRTHDSFPIVMNTKEPNKTDAGGN